MYLLFIVSLSIIIYFICMELDKPIPTGRPLIGECPDCSGRVESGWLVCPQCRGVLREACPACGKAHDRWVTYCPWCRYQHEEASA